MHPEEVAVLVKRLRKEPLYQEQGSARTVALGRGELRYLLPHRDPFLLIDGVDGFDTERQVIRGHRHIRIDDPVFAGHFPGMPVYPGVLQVEAMGQLGLCAAGLMHAGSNGDSGARPGVRATHIHHAMFLVPVEAGDDLVLHAGLIEDSGLTAISAGQIFKGSVLCAVAVQEVYFVD